MEKGIIYLMTTVVNGLIKIGKTGNEQFENSMRCLESNGYANITKSYIKSLTMFQSFLFF